MEGVPRSEDQGSTWKKFLESVPGLELGVEVKQETEHGCSTQKRKALKRAEVQS